MFRITAVNNDLATKQDKLKNPWGNSIELSVYDGTKTSFTVPKSGLYCFSVNPSSNNEALTYIYNSSGDGTPLYTGKSTGGAPIGMLVYLEANHTYYYINVSGAVKYNKVRLFYS